MYEIYNVRYNMVLSGGGDIWALGGNVVGHPRFETGKHVMPSNPVEFDEVNDVLTTTSGSKYKIMSYGVDRDSVVAQIKKDILNGGYEVH